MDYHRPVHREERFEEEVLEEDEAEVNLSKLDEEILEVVIDDFNWLNHFPCL